MQSPQVYFTLGGEEKPTPYLSIRERLQSSYKCQCSYTFTRVPSTSAELPEGILRKIIQRNFPESSKNMRPPPDEPGDCYKCRQGYADNNASGKLLLETPTNATEMQRGCSSSTGTRVLRLNSLEALLEDNCIVELPMPRCVLFLRHIHELFFILHNISNYRSRKVPLQSRNKNIRTGFTRSMLGTFPNDGCLEMNQKDSGYTWGMIAQGFTKKNRIQKSENNEQRQSQNEKEEWWWPIKRGLKAEAEFPLVDQPVSEALCILGDLDNCQVSLLSNNSGGGLPMPIGMSRLVSNMLEAFAYTWKEYHSPEQVTF